MNGYSLMADSYRTAAAQGKVDQDTAEKKARLFDFLGTCDQEEICFLFDSGAFNDIAKNYLSAACNNLVNAGTIDNKQGQAIKEQFSFLFSEMSAKEICEI